MTSPAYFANVAGPLHHEDVDISSTDHNFTPTPARGIYCGGAGNIVLKDMAGVECTYNNVAAGQEIVGYFTAVVRTNTTTTNMIARF